MTTPRTPDCYKCKYRGSLSSTPPFCIAFIDGIPAEIFYEGKKHDKKWPGQKNDLIFEPAPE